MTDQQPNPFAGLGEALRDLGEAANAAMARATFRMTAAAALGAALDRDDERLVTVLGGLDRDQLRQVFAAATAVGIAAGRALDGDQAEERTCDNCGSLAPFTDDDDQADDDPTGTCGKASRWGACVLPDGHHETLHESPDGTVWFDPDATMTIPHDAIDDDRDDDGRVDYGTFTAEIVDALERWHEGATPLHGGEVTAVRNAVAPTLSRLRDHARKQRARAEQAEKRADACRATAHAATASTNAAEVRAGHAEDERDTWQQRAGRAETSLATYQNSILPTVEARLTEQQQRADGLAVDLDNANDQTRKQRERAEEATAEMLRLGDLLREACDRADLADVHAALDHNPAPQGQSPS